MSCSLTNAAQKPFSQFRDVCPSVRIPGFFRDARHTLIAFTDLMSRPDVRVPKLACDVQHIGQEQGFYFIRTSSPG